MGSRRSKFFLYIKFFVSGSYRVAAFALIPSLSVFEGLKRVPVTEAHVGDIVCFSGCEDISIGDYVLTGGELAAQVVIDSVVRLLPGSLREASTVEESFENGLLEYPQYTKPAEWRGEAVPEVLLSGHHANIEKWRREKSLEVTQKKRPDLLNQTD